MGVFCQVPVCLRCVTANNPSLDVINTDVLIRAMYIAMYSTLHLPAPESLWVSESNPLAPAIIPNLI